LPLGTVEAGRGRSPGQCLEIQRGDSWRRPGRTKNEGWRHTLPAKGRTCPDPPRSPRRPAATHVSMATMETALKDGKHLQRPGSRAGPHLGQDVGDAWTKSLATRAAGNHRHTEFSFAPRDVRVAALSSPRATQHEGYSRHSVTWTGPSKWAWLPQMLRVARPFCGEAQ